MAVAIHVLGFHRTGVFSRLTRQWGIFMCGWLVQADDMSTASDNYDAVVAFLDRFPQIKKNPFYITGESYAGM
jgi:hypothetical protein